MQILSVGHSTHEPDAFVALLRRHDVQDLVDVRTVPRSRRVPHFNAEALPAILQPHGIGYRHAPELGGLRKPAKESRNTGWEHAGFRGYADHMHTDDFARALAQLERQARERAVAYMCAEGLWWRCHRRLISDALLVRGWAVLHILPNGDTKPHALTPFARVDGTTIAYPPAQTALDV